MHLVEKAEEPVKIDKISYHTVARLYSKNGPDEISSKLWTTT